MGCGSQKFAQAVEVESIKTLFIGIDMLTENILTVHRKQQTQVALNYNSLIKYIGGWILSRLKTTKETVYRLQFDNNYLIEQHRPGVRLLVNIVNVYIRRESSGAFFGIGTFNIIGNNTLEVEITPLNQIYLDSLVVQENSLDDLYREILQLLAAEYSEGRYFLEILYDPKVIHPQNIKELNNVIDMIIRRIGQTCNCLKQVNTHSLFSFTVLIFKNENQKIVSLQQFLFNNEFNSLFEAIIAAIRQDKMELQVQQHTKQTIYESFLSFFSFVLLVQYKYRVLLTAKQIVGQNVTVVELKQMQADNVKHCHYFYFDLMRTLNYSQQERMNQLYGDEMEIFHKRITCNNLLVDRSYEQSIQSALIINSLPTNNIIDAEMDDYDVHGIISYIQGQYDTIAQNNAGSRAFFVSINLQRINNEFLQEHCENICYEVQKYIDNQILEDNKSSYDDRIVSQVMENNAIQLFIQRITTIRVKVLSKSSPGEHSVFPGGANGKSSASNLTALQAQLPPAAFRDGAAQQPAAGGLSSMERRQRVVKRRKKGARRLHGDGGPAK